MYIEHLYTCEYSERGSEGSEHPRSLRGHAPRRGRENLELELKDFVVEQIHVHIVRTRAYQELHGMLQWSWGD